ncbi:hypothetical protein [Cyanobium sp. CH-040]|uniref:hypothetical protein n=1 Tax=Cyanobium sp. CH-040 TaxID=2823708 RepID=UPI0020CB82B8|nr:hypothetical protein [Cyanobium sp. CH-040]MCP9926395.1 hypothetical protein [Cyanobium sp. CH-040]
MTPINPQDLRKVLEALPKEREDPFPHLAFLTPEGLLQRRVEVSEQLKVLEQERQAIDEELSTTYSPAELRRGIRVPGGCILRQRTRTSWQYAPEIRNVIRAIQKDAQESGEATELRTTYLVLTQEDF